MASFDDLQQAQGAALALEQAGVERQRISVAARDPSAEETAQGDALCGADPARPRWRVPLIGAASGAAAGWLGAALVALAAPEIGLVVASGWLLSVLGALYGATWGGVYEGIDAGIDAETVAPECAHTCVERLKRGDTVLAVSASQAETEGARGILSSHKAREICLIG